MVIELTRRKMCQGIAATAAWQSGRGRASAGTLGDERSLRPLAGVNLAGAEFGKVPGRYGDEYLYPGERSISYFASLGFKLVRVPFRWERLQPVMYQEFERTEQARLDRIVNLATGKGLQMVLDPHNFAKRRLREDGWRNEHIIGSRQVPAGAFVDLWSRLATRYGNRRAVIFGLMNEPNDLLATDWVPIAGAALAEIRRQGAENLVFVPGVAFTGAHSWFDAGNDAMAEIHDRNMAIEVHQYFDADSSGTSDEAVSGTIGSERIEQFQEWARGRGLNAFLGEFNGGKNAASLNALRDICSEMSANADVWMGWAAWAGGAGWPDDFIMNLEPHADGRPRAQTEVLSGFASRGKTGWVREGAAVDLDFARGVAHGSLGLEQAFERAAQLGIGTGLTRTRKGLHFESTAHGLATADATAPLNAILRQRVLTLVIDVRELPAAPTDCIIASVEGKALLTRLATGAVSSVVPQLRTAPQPLSNWAAKRRVGLAVDLTQGRSALGATGARTIMSSGGGGPNLQPLQLGSISAGGLTGYVTRITVYPRFIEAAQLDALLA